ncbi:MAG: Na+/H+ antiporter subunit E [Hyphomicrobium sp.]|nr:Na+/H+ antiporter subunit E [Hyphomicrobium sp.]MBN9280584.1 Na+/H+ antiporter subunit E [Hyphomicrobium sp.]
MRSAADGHSSTTSAAFMRGAGLLVFWLILSAFSAADLPAGVLAAAAATWASLKLLPPGRMRLRPLLLAELLLRFVFQSVVAGCDAAWRALDPRSRLRTGFVSYRPVSPPGTMRSAFLTMASLQPGLLPSGFNDDGTAAIHCLDVEQPVAQQLSLEEARLLAALGMEHDDV